MIIFLEVWVPPREIKEKRKRKSAGRLLSIQTICL